MRALILIVLTLIPLQATAQTQGRFVFPSGTVENLIRPAVPGECHRSTITSTHKPMARANSAVQAGSNVGLVCIPFGSVVRVECTNAVKVAVVQSSTIATFGRSNDVYDITDNGGTILNWRGRPAQMLWVRATTSERFVMHPGPWTKLNTVTMRPGRCTVNAATAGTPCDANNDCSTDGVCVFDRPAGCAFLLMEADSTTATCNVCVEQ